LRPVTRKGQYANGSSVTLQLFVSRFR